MKKFFIFIAGAVIGSAVTWKVSKDYYEKLVQEDFDSRRFKPEDGKSEPDITEQDKEDYKRVLKQVNYSEYANQTIPEQKEVKEVTAVDRPYIISPNEFGELDDYETISLAYYDDGVLADDLDELVEDVDDVVGLDSLNHFGEYEDDSVFVRNDRLKADYEILLDHRNYSDVIQPIQSNMR